VKPNGVVAWHLTYDGGDINYRATPLASISGESAITDERFALHAR
jgi:hypothetical protein